MTIMIGEDHWNCPCGWRNLVIRTRCRNIHCSEARPALPPSPFQVGQSYATQVGEIVRFVKVHNEGTYYETMEDERGVHRYTRRDFGRVTGSAHDYSDPRNTSLAQGDN